MRLRCAALIAALTLGLCAAARGDTALHPGDKIEVTVFNHPELSGSRTIDAAGNVSLPVAGTVSAADLDTQALADQIRRRLVAYVRDPAVQVQLDAQSASIFVVGGPVGVLPYAPGLTLTAAVDRLNAPVPVPVVDAAQGQQVAFHDVATSSLDLVNGPIDFHAVRILRDGQELGPFDVAGLRAQGQTGPPLMPGDTIQLADKPIAVSVAGDVETPGTAHLAATEPLSAAITQVGGVASSARLQGIELIRDGTSRLVSLGSPVMSLPAQNGDRLVVPRAARVNVMGSVQKPGDTVLRGDDTLVSAIYYAGGPVKFADLGHVAVVHDGVRHIYNLGRVPKGAASQNPTLADGDVVFVPQGSTFQWSEVWDALGSLGLFGVHI